MNETTEGGTQSSETELFKFRKINKRLIDSLVMSHLWCARPDTLNDPLDCQINLRNSWIRATSLAVGEKKDWLERILEKPELFERLETPLKESGICSFSLHLAHHRYSSVQWAHYADEHRGVCLLYRFPKSYIWDPENQIVGVSDVTYKDNALTNWLVDSPMNIDEFLTGFIKKFLTIKSPAWEYEQEVRIIRKTPGPLNIPFGFLEQVCFGLRTPQSDIDLIKKLAREHCGCNSFARIVHDNESDFGIKAVEI